ncbi:hypothetical protein [Emcibacter nanhaiensis]|uniref:Uncharacterized protein n=1 Tax=Emcibacter nanhaiensis TaxID=1505037 RepID=A0A501PRG3_9PROT|nr:hypothetical protein [Emcibacter nanhaiensis]TPD62748.1 hypothetical protein FIV46_01330 [Emcibacter nanhaiensis]
MFGLTKAQLTVIGFVLFFLAVTFGGELYNNWLYDKEQHLPRLVMRLEQADGQEFIVSISQKDYKEGMTDLMPLVDQLYPDREGLLMSETVDCLEFRTRIKETMAVAAKEELKQRWEYEACYPERK